MLKQLTEYSDVPVCRPKYTLVIHSTTLDRSAKLPAGKSADLPNQQPDYHCPHTQVPLDDLLLLRGEPIFLQIWLVRGTRLLLASHGD